MNEYNKTNGMDDDDVDQRSSSSSSPSSSSFHFLFLTHYMTIINFSPRTNYFRVEKLKEFKREKKTAKILKSRAHILYLF